MVEVVEFPEEDESTGEIVVGFFGPNCTDVLQATAINVLLTRYLCGSSVSVLENVIVEKEELASSVSYWWDSRPNSVIWLQPTGVATEKLAFVEQRLMSLLKEVASKPLDMVYMKDCIRRERRQVMFQAEDSEQFYSNNLITDFLFGTRDGSTLKDLKTLNEYDVLETWTDEMWREFLRKWMSDAHHVSILGKPSMALAAKLKADEEARVLKRKEELGPEGLKKLAERLEEAKKANDQAIPEAVLDQWPVPGTESIHFIESHTARSGIARRLGEPSNKSQKIIDRAPQAEKPLFIQFEDVPTNFVHITMHIGTSQTPLKLKPLLSLFGDNFFNSPMLRGEKRIEFEQVVMELEKDTISYQLGSGSKVGDWESMLIQFQIEPEKYATIVEWIRALMFDSIFDLGRLKTCITKALADVPESKRDGRVMASEVDMAIHFRKESFPVSKRTLVKAVYLRRLKRLLEREPELVIGWFEELRRTLFTLSNVRVLVTANLAKLENPVATWDILATTLAQQQQQQRHGSDTVSMVPIVVPHTMLSEEGRKPGSYGAVIIPMTTVEGSYSVSTAKGTVSFSDPRLPAILVTIGYLEAVEGPLWNAVRGNGLAYGVSFSRELDGGYLQYKVYRSPDASKALAASEDAVRKLATGQAPLERFLVEGAVSQVVMAFADDQATMAAAAQQNFVLGVVRSLEPDWNQKMLERVRAVSPDEIRAVMHDLVLPVFRPSESNVVVTCAPLLQEVRSNSSRLSHTHFFAISSKYRDQITH